MNVFNISEPLLRDCLRLDLQSGKVSVLEQAECEINSTLIHYYSCIDASATERANKTKYKAAPTPICQAVLVTLLY